MPEYGRVGPNMTIFMLKNKNLQGWTDKVEQVQKGTVVLRFDAQDAETG